ncbi:hypothetical protein ACOMHN_050560 [Nucella lapillus]
MAREPSAILRGSRKNQRKYGSDRNLSRHFAAHSQHRSSNPKTGRKHAKSAKVRNEATAERASSQRGVPTALTSSNKNMLASKADHPNKEWPSIHQPTQKSAHPLIWISNRRLKKGGIKLISKVKTWGNGEQFVKPTFQPDSGLKREEKKNPPRHVEDYSATPYLDSPGAGAHPHQHSSSDHPSPSRPSSPPCAKSVLNDNSLNHHRSSLTKRTRDKPFPLISQGKRTAPNSSEKQGSLKEKNIADHRNRFTHVIKRRDADTELSKTMDILFNKNEHDRHIGTRDTFLENSLSRTSPQNPGKSQEANSSQGNQTPDQLPESQPVNAEQGISADIADLYLHQEPARPADSLTQDTPQWPQPADSLTPDTPQWPQPADLTLDDLIRTSIIGRVQLPDALQSPGFSDEPAREVATPHGKKDLSRTEHLHASRAGPTESHLALPDQGGGQVLEDPSTSVKHPKRSVASYEATESFRAKSELEMEMEMDLVDKINVGDEEFDHIIMETRIQPEELVLDDRVPDDVALRRRRGVGKSFSHSTTLAPQCHGSLVRISVAPGG